MTYEIGRGQSRCNGGGGVAPGFGQFALGVPGVIVDPTQGLVDWNPALTMVFLTGESVGGEAVTGHQEPADGWVRPASPRRAAPKMGPAGWWAMVKHGLGPSIEKMVIEE